MILNKTSEYALTILGYMATRDKEIYSAKLLHQELHIPRRYLRRLLTDLSKHGFLNSNKGRTGGFIFAKQLKDINFLQVIEAMEGEEFFSRCIFGFSSCLINSPCIMHDSWSQVNAKLKETLKGTNLESLRKKYLEDSGLNLHTQ
jgi:Rrf2 family protein